MPLAGGIVGLEHLGLDICSIPFCRCHRRRLALKKTMTPNKRDRSLEGCGTCRSRHVKCDAQRPICQMCISSGMTCTGYEIRLRFVHDGEPEPLEIEDATRFRRPLFTGK